MGDLQLSAFQPRSQLVTTQTRIDKPRFPVVDGHNHLAEPFGGGWDKKPVSELLDLLDSADIRAYIDLDGGWGESILNHHLDYFKGAAPERFRIFGGVDWEAWPEHGNAFGEWAAGRLRAQLARGADGLKIWKPLGLSVKDARGRLVAIDDPRLDGLWATAAEAGVPVVIHIADPVAFFTPLDSTNERWDELSNFPEWHFPSPPFPSFQKLIEDFANLVRRHPATTFIGAHVGCYAENLGWVRALLAECPNFYVDMSARISELGRQPYSARKFFIDFADRIIFGTDAGPDVAAYRRYFRFLESADEYFNYGGRPIPGQGRWQIYGLYLPDDVLRKIYYANSCRLFGLDLALFEGAG